MNAAVFCSMAIAATSGARRASSRKKTSAREKVNGRCKEEDNRLWSSDAGEHAVGVCGKHAGNEGALRHAVSTGWSRSSSSSRHG
jgi:hypothetical protein